MAVRKPVKSKSQANILLKLKRRLTHTQNQFVHSQAERLKYKQRLAKVQKELKEARNAA